jgi:hypothetical protein
MDRVKQEFVAIVHSAIRQCMESPEGFASIEDQYDEQVSFELQEVSPLIIRLRINQGPYKGPRYFDVIVKETT